MEARNVADLVRRSATEHPDKPALVDTAGTIGPGDAPSARRVVSWSELDHMVDRLAAGLTGRLQLSPGDRIGILLPNSVEFVAIYFAALRAGLVVVPLNIGYTSAELSHQLMDADMAHVVTGADYVDRLDLPPGRVTVVGAADGSWESLCDGADAGSVESVSGGEDLAVLLYTSGTSGRPRGAMLSHRALLANLDQVGQIEPKIVESDDIVLLVLPLFHVYGLNAGLGMVASAGATAVLAQRFEPVETLALIRDESITNVVGAPPMYVAWSMLPDLGESLSSVRLAISGSAALPPVVLSAVLESSGRHVFEGYGLTETAPVLTSTLCSEVAKPGSVGRPVPGVEVRIVDPAAEEVEDDDPGELVVRGANLFSGYWPDGRDGPDEQGWFPTGDIAYADADGDLYLVDRVRELILVSGFNVYPREVEDALSTHPAVAEAAVLGVPHPYTGETVKALVVLREGETATQDELIDHVATRLARFKCPTSVEIVAELPHSAAGKVAKGRLRETSDATR